MRDLVLIGLLVIGTAGCATATGNGEGNQVITCTVGSDCDEKWSRAMQWLQENSSSKVTATDTKLTTQESLDTAKPAFEVTKAAQTNDKQRFEITMRAWCAAGCDDLIAKLRSSFNDYVVGQ